MTKPGWSFLRAMAWLEALSFIALLGAAMPLKYLAGRPGAVQIVGWIHGVLFRVFCAALLRAMIRHRWSFPRAALVPFGPFVFDRRFVEGESRAPAGA